MAVGAVDIDEDLGNHGEGFERDFRAQVERMLKDPKAERFMGDFIDQWLDVREFDLTSPDRLIDLCIRSFPRSIFRARSTSPSRVSSGTAPISRR